MDYKNLYEHLVAIIGIANPPNILQKCTFSENQFMLQIQSPSITHALKMAESLSQLKWLSSAHIASVQQMSTQTHSFLAIIKANVVS